MVAIKDMLGDQTVVRADGRKVDELRPVRITRHFTDVPEGSVLIECGNTRVMCTATFTAGVPRWRKDSGLGWVTAEYAMLPRATADRTDRESVRGKIGGRTHEISRLIGRCLRGVVDMKALGENQVQIDCDVLQADGGTRTASITGAYVALVDAMHWAEEHKHVKSADRVLKDWVSAVSVGVINGKPMLDLPYIEDSQAMTDMNVAMTGSGDFIEIQGTAEHRPFNRAELNTLLDLAESCRPPNALRSRSTEPIDGTACAECRTLTVRCRRLGAHGTTQTDISRKTTEGTVRHEDHRRHA